MTHGNKRLPIIALDYTRWRGNWMGRQHILSRLGERGWPVLYSNGASYYNEISFSKPFGTVEETDNVTLYHAGFLPPRNYRIKFLDRLAIKQHCRVLKKRAGLTTGDKFIAFCFHPDFYPYVEELNAPYVMFHIYDVYHLIGAPEGESSNVKKLIDQSNLVTAASEMMWEQVVGTTSHISNIIHNGVDFSQYDIEEKVHDQIMDKIKAIPSPKVGYVGAINLKIDFKLIYELASLRSDINFIFVGNILKNGILKNKIIAEYYQKCQNSLNVHFLGPIAKDLVPQTLKQMDINAIFYTQNEVDWVQAGYPLKINEYLATGKPVITSYMPILEKYFSQNITICRSMEDWNEAIDLACLGQSIGTVESRKNKAKENDWGNRVDKLEQLMSTMLTGEAGPENN